MLTSWSANFHSIVASIPCTLSDLCPWSLSSAVFNFASASCSWLANSSLAFVVEDAMSRRSYMASQPGDPAFNNQKQILLGPSKLLTTIVYATPLDSSLLDTIRQRLRSDDFAKDVLAHIIPSPSSCFTLEGPSQHYQEFKWQEGLFCYKNLLYVLDGSPLLQVLEHCHDAPMAGHFGILPRSWIWWSARFGGLICKTLSKIMFAHVTPVVKPTLRSHRWVDLKISCKLSSAYYRQTDGKKERTNQMLD